MSYFISLSFCLQFGCGLLSQIISRNSTLLSILGVPLCAVCFINMTARVFSRGAHPTFRSTTSWPSSGAWTSSSPWASARWLAPWPPSTGPPPNQFPRTLCYEPSSGHYGRHRSLPVLTLLPSPRRQPRPKLTFPTSLGLVTAKLVLFQGSMAALWRSVLSSSAFSRPLGCF